MNKTLLIFLLLIESLVACSQADSSAMSIGIGGGIDLISNKDLSASPLNYNGIGLPIGINGFKWSSKWINHFEVQLILPLLTNNYTLSSKAATHLISWNKVNLRYQLLRQVGKHPHNYLGGQIRTDFFYREYDFLDGFSWEFQNSLNLSYARKINLSNKSYLLPQVSMPLFGYLNRKPSLTFDEAFLEDFNNGGTLRLLKYGKWRFPFQNWISFQFDLLYHLKLSERLNLQGRFGLNYYSIGFPEKVTNINTPIRCYINYQF